MRVTSALSYTGPHLFVHFVAAQQRSAPMNAGEAWQNILGPVGQSMSSKAAGGSSALHIISVLLILQGKTSTKLDSSESFGDCFFSCSFLNIWEKKIILKLSAGFT